MEQSPEVLVGWHVVEAGRRQNWPFLTFAQPSSGREVRLYIDAEFRVEPAYPPMRQHDDAALLALDELNMCTLTEVTVGEGGLRLSFPEGVLSVAAEANELTSGPPWWLGRSHS